MDEFESSHKFSTFTKCRITITPYKTLNTFLHNLFHFAIHCPQSSERSTLQLMQHNKLT